MSRILLCLFAISITAGVAVADEGPAQETSSRRYTARVADYRFQEQEDVKPMPTVFDSEAEYRASNYHALYHGGGVPGFYGYTPGCCDEAHYAVNLWSGYCETRKQTWYSRWLVRFGGGCGDCGKSSCDGGKCK